MENWFRLNTRKLRNTEFLSIEVTRTVRGKEFTKVSVEKVIPRIIEYDLSGDVEVKTADDLLNEVKPLPYWAGNEDFNNDRLANVDLSNIVKHLEAFPNLTPRVEGGKKVQNVLSEVIYSGMVFLRRDESVESEVKKKGYLNGSKLHAEIIQKAVQNYEDQTGEKIDLHAVPKRSVGQLAYVGDKKGVAGLSKMFNFGLHTVLPTDRQLRELSSMHSCEVFNRSNMPASLMTPSLGRYFTIATVAVVMPETDFLDTGIITEQGTKTFAATLEHLQHETDIWSIDPKDLNIDFLMNKATMTAAHRVHTVINEDDSPMGTIRLVMPGGVKFAATPFREACSTLDGESVDLILDYRTLARKGALGLFFWDEREKIGQVPNKRDVKESYLGQKQNIRQVFWRGVKYDAFILHIPVCRPGQRYTQLCKPCRIGTDLITHAILDMEVIPSKRTEETYQKLVDMRKRIQDVVL